VETLEKSVPHNLIKIIDP